MRNLGRLLLSSLLIASLSSMITDRNVIYVLANANDQLIFEHELLPLNRLTDTLKTIIVNENDIPEYPEKREISIEYFGKVRVPKVVVSIACDRGTTYEFYIKVQNEVERAFNELRNELALKQFKTAYELLPPDKQQAINKYYPKRISEAEPRQLD